MEKRGMWSSRFTFILAAIGSAVGLGNAWRFPGLAAKHGGGTFLVVYLFAMLAMGIPLGILLMIFSPWACELFFGEGGGDMNDIISEG